MRTVAVVTALEKEAEVFFEALGTAGETRWGMHVGAGVAHGVRLAVAVAGMGIVNTAAATQFLIQEHHPDALVFSGIAGGLNPRLFDDDIVVGAHLEYLRTDTALIAESAPHLERFVSDSGLVALAARTLDESGFRRVANVAERGDVTFAADPAAAGKGPAYTAGTIATSTVFTTGEDELNEEVAVHHADCEEMEGAAAAHIAAKCGVPSLVVRAISNRCGEAYDDLSGRDDDLRRSARLVGSLVLAIIDRM